MDFRLSEDQLLLAEGARDFLRAELTTERVRAAWNTPTGRDDGLWKQLAELGLTGVLVPESHGGLGLGEVDFVSIIEACGYVALPEPLVDTALLGATLLRDAGHAALAAEWLPRIAAGEARIAVGHPVNPLVADAHVADLLLLPRGDGIHALARTAVSITANESLDPSRRLFRVDWEPGAGTLRAKGDAARSLLAATLDRGALAAAAECQGLTQRLLDLAVGYTRDRKQFGQVVGSFQAVQHLLANVAVKHEYAKAPLQRAASEIARGTSLAALAVSHAKLAATEAAALAARHSIQVHGAMGYTWEVDVHIFAKRAWVLDAAWGDRAFHKLRVADAVLTAGAAIGPGSTFG
ncbi:MAG: acyl-CoA dehydrogenase family protein [Gammaproteobacteria bacterium]